MHTTGSVHDRMALPALLGPVAVFLGLAAMYGTMAFAGGFGLRPALILAEAALAMPGIVMMALVGIPVARGLALHTPDRRIVFLAIGAGVSLWAGSLGLLELQYCVWRPPPGYLEAFRRLHQALRPTNAFEAFLSVAAIAIAPAAGEEVLFRGIVLPSFRRALGATGAVLVAAVLFGLIHLDFTQPGAPVLYRVPFAFVVGAALGSLRVLTGGLAAPILAHAVLNTITLGATPFMDDPEGLPDPKPLLGALLLLAGTVISAILFSRIRRAPR